MLTVTCWKEHSYTAVRTTCHRVTPMRKVTRLRGLGPLTFGSVDRRPKNVSPEKTKTCETAKEQLTPQLTPKFQKQGKIDTSELPSDLAEIVSVWPELPEHIKAAIKALVQTYTDSKRG